MVHLVVKAAAAAPTAAATEVAAAALVAAAEIGAAAVLEAAAVVAARIASAAVIWAAAADPVRAALAAAPAVGAVAVVVRAAVAAHPVWAVHAEAVDIAAAHAAAADIVAAHAAAVAAAVVAAEDDAVRAGGETMNKKSIFKMKNAKRSRPLFLVTAIAFVACLVFAAAVAAQTAGRINAKAFASADDAATALLAAASSYDEAALKEILGPDSYDIIHSGEPTLDRQNSLDFAAKGAEKKYVAFDPRSKTRAFLEVGEDGWPFPVPIVKQGTKWYFDTKAGRQELLYRRIGSNELTAINVCDGFVEAQNEYALTKHDGAIVNQYAQRIISSPGKRDGLAWQNADGSWGGTVGERAAKAIEEAYTGKPAPFHGYYFKVLKGQGPAARLGELDFMVDGSMIGGFALIAVPASYQVTGVKTFMVSHEGVIYEKDLGPKSLEIAKTIERFNPDRTWRPVKD